MFLEDNDSIRGECYHTTPLSCLGRSEDDLPVSQVVNFHALRTRRAGSQRYIDLHLVMNGDISLLQTPNKIIGVINSHPL